MSVCLAGGSITNNWYNSCYITTKPVNCPSRMEGESKVVNTQSKLLSNNTQPDCPVTTSDQQVTLWHYTDVKMTFLDMCGSSKHIHVTVSLFTHFLPYVWDFKGFNLVFKTTVTKETQVTRKNILKKKDKNVKIYIKTGTFSPWLTSTRRLDLFWRQMT
jgi:hypothetical protein